MESHAAPEKSLDPSSNASLAALEARVSRRIDAINAQIAGQGEMVPAETLASRWEIRAAALHQQARSGNTHAQQHLLAALQDEHPAVRGTAVFLLGKLGTQVPLEHFMLPLRDVEAEVRERAVLALAGRTDSAVPSLLAVAQCDDAAEVRSAALLVGERAATVTAVATPTSTTPRLLAPAQHCWQVLTRQWALLPRQWLAAVALLFSGYAVTLLLLPEHGRSHMHDLALLLGFVTTVASAIEIAFAANLRLDAGTELLLATPTSPRLVVCSRFALLMTVNTLCSLGMSALVALLAGQGLWGIVQIWFGPWLFIASLTLALTVLIGSSLALVTAVALAVAQTLHINVAGQVTVRPAAGLLPTNGWMIVLALLCMVWALWSASRRPWTEMQAEV